MSAGGDIQFSIKGLGQITEAAVSGVSLHYGINMIPYVNLSLNVEKVEEQESQLLCNPDSYKDKNKPITINIKTKTGCINFIGFLDGISFSQSVGNISYTAIIKSKFQSLVEVCPRAYGYSPYSFKPFRSVETIKVNGEPFNSLAQVRVGDTNVDGGKKIAEFLLQLIVAMVKSQKNLENNINTDDPDYLPIITHEKYQKNIEKVLNMLENQTDTLSTSNTKIIGANCGQWLADMLLGDDFTTLWDMLVYVFNEINCVLICGKEKLFVVPRSQFLKLKNHDKPDVQEPGPFPNKANPVDINHLVVSDNGYCNIRYCLNVIEPYQTMPHDFTGITNNKPGKYIATDAEAADSACGLHLNKLSLFALTGLMYIGGTNKTSKQEGNGADSQPPPNSFYEPTQQITEPHDQIIEDHRKQQDTLDHWAKVAFLNVKFGDRCASFTMQFNPNWVPGATASVYTRVPGLFFQGYVTNVTHEIVSSVPNELKVVTTVNLNCIRQAGETESMQGVDSDQAYDYTYSDMEKYWNRWLGDVTK